MNELLQDTLRLWNEIEGIEKEFFSEDQITRKVKFNDLARRLFHHSKMINILQAKISRPIVDQKESDVFSFLFDLYFIVCTLRSICLKIDKNSKGGLYSEKDYLFDVAVYNMYRERTENSRELLDI